MPDSPAAFIVARSISPAASHCSRFSFVTKRLTNSLTTSRNASWSSS